MSEFRCASCNHPLPDGVTICRRCDNGAAEAALSDRTTQRYRRWRRASHLQLFGLIPVIMSVALSPNRVRGPVAIFAFLYVVVLVMIDFKIKAFRCPSCGLHFFNYVPFSNPDRCRNCGFLLEP